MILTTLLFWQHTGCWEQAELPPSARTLSGEHWRPIRPVTSCKLMPRRPRIPEAAAELDCTSDVSTGSCEHKPNLEDEGWTHVLDAVAALDVTSVAASGASGGGREGGESEEGGNGNEGSEHGGRVGRGGRKGGGLVRLGTGLQSKERLRTEDSLPSSTQVLILEDGRLGASVRPIRHGSLSVRRCRIPYVWQVRGRACTNTSPAATQCSRYARCR